MTSEQKSRLLEMWSTYFPGAELPVAFFRSDEAHGASPSRPAKGWRCFIGDLAAVRRGQSVYYARETVGCGRRYLGLDTSDYAVKRFGRSRNVRPGSWGQMAELRFDEPFDLVVCSDALHYVPTREVVRGLECLPELIGGVAYFDFLTADDDLETGIEGDMVGFKMRRAAWYRRKFRGAGLMECGLGFWAAPDLAPQITALERAPGSK